MKPGLVILLVVFPSSLFGMAIGYERSRISCCFIDIFCATMCLHDIRALHPGAQHRIRHPRKHLMRLLRQKRPADTVSNLGK